MNNSSLKFPSMYWGSVMENRHIAIFSKAVKQEYYHILIPLNLKKCHSKQVHVFKTIKSINQPIVFSCDKIYSMILSSLLLMSITFSLTLHSMLLLRVTISRSMINWSLIWLLTGARLPLLQHFIIVSRCTFI